MSGVGGRMGMGQCWRESEEAVHTAHDSDILVGWVRVHEKTPSKPTSLFPRLRQRTKYTKTNANKV